MIWGSIDEPGLIHPPLVHENSSLSAQQPKLSPRELQPSHCDSIFNSQITQKKCVKTHFSVTCMMPKCKIDTNKISGSMGGEELDLFQSTQGENKELLFYYFGTLVCEETIPNTYQNSHINRFIKTVQLNDHLSNANDYSTILVKRGDYANPCMTMASLFNVWQIIKNVSPAKYRIIWLDGHPLGALDSIWKDLFDVRPVHIQKMTDGSIHPSYIVNAVSAFGDEGLHSYFKSPDICNEMSDLLVFRNMVLRKYQIERTPIRKKQITLLVRKDFKAHLRSDGITDRKVVDSDEAVDFLKTKYLNHDVRKVSFEDISFREQLSIISNTDIFISVHGAGNIHVIFLPKNAVFYELFPPGFTSRNRFQFLSMAVGVR